MTRRPASPSGRSRLGRLLSVLAAPTLAVPLLTGAASPGGAADETGAVPSATVVSALTGGNIDADPITLITGDQVLVQPASEGRDSAVVEPAPRPSGQEPQFEVLDEGDDLYVIPDDAATLIPDRLDRELFNVTKLADYGYTDGVSVIVTDEPARTLAAREKEGLSVTSRLSSVDGYAATVEPNGDWWSTIAPATGGFATAARPSGQKVWLDEIAEVGLDESVPMIGAPEAWANGYDGTGTTVAVLDTGIDQGHPDLDDNVVGTRNFTSDAGIKDEHGHGTHVASTIAGSGDGSNGQYKGVAPGADLLIGKICDSSGSCPTSGTLAAMEWAVTKADVINMSIGSNYGAPQTSPSAMAINELSAEHPDTLFVVAAGNNGRQGAFSIASPGSADAALTVGAVDKDGNLAAFSSTGPRVGDHGLKPDVTAPGVGIVAARGEGTSMGSPVNDLYTAANGTSMATPHVAGAAAIAMQAAPELTAQQVKAAFVATGTSHPDLTVYEQGGGLVDIPAALATPVVAVPASVHLGFHAYPQDDTSHEQVEVSWTNRSDADVTLDLALDVANGNGDVPPAEALSVTPSTVTVPAGGSATATVALDANGLPAGDYGGVLGATGTGVDLELPVGFFVEPEMTELTIHATTRDGSPAQRASSVFVVDAHSPASGYERLRFTNGVASGRFRPGNYYVVGTIATRDGNDRWTQDSTWIAAPTVDLTEDVTLEFDARDAEPVVVDTPEHPKAADAAQFRKMTIGYGGQFRDADNFSPQWIIGSYRQSFMLASGPAQHGELEVAASVRLAEAPLELEVTSPEQRDVYIRPMSGSPEIDMDEEFELVSVGAGNEVDYEGVDVAGKAVLVQRTPTDYLDYDTYEQTARAHGAAAMIMMHDTTGRFVARVGDAQIPSMAISGPDGQQLLDDLAAGDVTVRVSGSTSSPYLYDVTMIRDGALTNGLRETVHTEDMVTVHNSFHGEPGEAMSEYRSMWRPYVTFSAQQTTDVKGAQQREDYVTVRDDSLYRQQVHAQAPLEGGLREHDVIYPEVIEVTHNWFKGVMHPTVLDPHPPLSPGFPVLRTGDTMPVRLPEWSDSDDQIHQGSRDSTTDSQYMKVWLDGTYLGQARYPSIRIDNLPTEEARLRFEVMTARDADWWQTSTETLTNWTFTTSHASEPALQPMLDIDYNTEVDLTNTAVRPEQRQGPATLDLHVRHQAGYEGGPIAGAKVWISYDDGATWEKRPVLKQAGAGNYQAVLDSPAADDTPTGYVTVKVAAWDSDGNRIEQEVTRAWRLSNR